MCDKEMCATLQARDAAEFSECSNDEGGVGKAIERSVLEPRGVALGFL